MARADCFAQVCHSRRRPGLCMQVGPVSHIDFCQTYPYNFAATSSTRVRGGRLGPFGMRMHARSDLASTANHSGCMRIRMAGRWWCSMAKTGKWAARSAGSRMWRTAVCFDRTASCWLLAAWMAWSRCVCVLTVECSKRFQCIVFSSATHITSEALSSSTHYVLLSTHFSQLELDVHSGGVSC